MSRTRSKVSRDKTLTADASGTSRSALQHEIGRALRSLQDRSALNRSPLARRPYVENLAKRQYADRLLPRGFALRAVLESCISEVIGELGVEPAFKKQCDYLRLLKQGVRCKEIGRSLGYSREHVSRKYRKEALILVSEAFQRKTGHRQ